MFDYFLGKKRLIILLASCFLINSCATSPTSEQEAQLKEEITKDRHYLNQCLALQRAFSDTLETIGFPSIDVGLTVNANKSPLLTSASAKLAASNAQAIPDRIKSAMEKLYQLEITEESLQEFRDEATGTINEIKVLVETTQPELEELKNALIILSEIDVDEAAPEYQQAKELVEKASKAEEIPSILGEIKVQENNLSNLKIKLLTELCF